MNKIKNALYRAMQGRYGVDTLSRDLSWFAIGLMILGLILKIGLLRNLGLIVILVSYLRMFSKKLNKRYRENYAYSGFKRNISKKVKASLQRIKDLPKYKYIRCPECNKQLRLPRGKKDIVVNCPKCHHKFDART